MTDPLSSAAPAPNPAPAPVEGGAAPAPLETQAAPEQWFSGIKDEGARTWAEAKGWKDPLAAVESAYNLEKLIGFDKAGRTIVVPDEKSTPEQVQAFRAKMGVPEKADGYKLPVPEGDDGAFAKTASAWFHEAGISAAAAEKLSGKWNEFQTQAAQAQEAQFNTQAEQDLGKLRTEFGAAYDQNIELARRAARQFMPSSSDAERDAMLGKMQRAMGTEAYVKLFSKIGEGLGEHKVHGDGSSGLILSPAQAKQRIAELKSNKEWSASYLTGDKAKMAEMTDLQKLAFPEE